MNENTKDEAHAGSFGLRVLFTTPGIEREELTPLLTEAVRSVGEGIVGQGRTLIGHVKAFASVPGGSLRINMVDLDLGPEKEDRLPEGAIVEGEMRLMAAAVGLTDEELERIVKGSLEPLGLRLELGILGLKHEH